MNDNYEQLEALLAQKDFAGLSPQQQTWVQDFMSAEEYAAQRKILTESKAILSEKSILPAGDLASLQAQFKAKYKRSFGHYWGKPIAAYQALLLASAVGIVVWWLRPTQIEIQTQIQTQTELVYKTKTDTIIQEKIVYQEKVVYQTTTKTITLPAPAPDTVYMPFANKEIFYKEKPQEPILANSGSQSKSMKDMGGLMDFVVESY